MMMMAGMIEAFGISMVMPLVTIIMNDSVIYSNEKYYFFYNLFHMKSSADFIIFVAVVLIIIYVLKNIYLMIEYKFQITYIYSCKKDISLRLMKCYVHQNYLFHVEHNVATLQQNVIGDVGNFFIMIQALMNLLIELITSSFIILYLFYVDCLTTIALIIVLGGFVFGIYRVFKKFQVRAGISSRRASETTTKWFLQTFGGIKEIKALNKEDYFYLKFEQSYDEMVKASKRSSLLSKYPKHVFEAVCITCLLLVVCIRASTGMELVSFAATLSAFVIAAVRLLPSFNRITEAMGSILFSRPFLDKVYTNLKEQEKLDCSLIKSYSKNEKMIFEHDLRIENISFRYANNTEYIFKNAYLSIIKNKSIAFIGASGAGKTTLADIILGLIIPDKGDVLVDGKSIYSNLNGWHNTIGYIPQTIYLMDESIRDNIIFGNDEHDEKLIWNCLEMAQISDYVRSLPNGLDTYVGDRGVKLSGGQRQRLGIARALYSKPELLILDEATSALDTSTELDVMKAVEHLRGKMTLIIIAHRLSTIEHCDEVYEVREGKIIKK